MREFLHSFEKLEFEKVKQHIQRYSSSDLGRELLHNLRPASDLEEIHNRLNLVSEMKFLLEGDDPLPLQEILDVRASLHRSSIEDLVLPAVDLRKISLILHTSQLLAQYISRRKGKYPLLEKIVHAVSVNKVVEYNINQAIDEDSNVKDSASKELATIRRQIVESNLALKKSLERILKSVGEKGWSQEEIITTREGRMVIPLKVEHKSQISGFIHSTSASGATVFIEPTETLELNNEVRTLQFKEQREIEKILRSLTVQIREIRESLLMNLEILGRLDFIQSKAKYSIEIMGTAPVIADDSVLRIRNGLHPLLLQKHLRTDLTPLDIEIGSDHNTLIISGPNAGGKSVAMKTIGLFSLLAQSGCHVPSSPGTELPLFDSIFVDMGDEQSIENDLSSFSSHLQNLNVICENVTRNSLVLIDEIASGTDPTEGAALGAAVLEHLTSLGCKTIVTTHHGNLKSFAFGNAGIRNGAMEFNQDTLTPTYKFRSGIPGSSYALEMAQRMKLSPRIIERSRQIKGEDSNKLEYLLLELERQSMDYREKLSTLSDDQEKINSLIQLYKKRITDIEKEVKVIKSEALQEAQKILSRASATIEQTVKDIKLQSAANETVRNAKKEIKKVFNEFAEEYKVITPENRQNATFKIGDTVRLRSSSTIGIVSSVIDKNTYLIVAGDLKIKSKGQDLEITQEKISNYIKSNNFETPNEVKRELDLRGLYADEAIIRIEKFIDDAILVGLTRIDIIHGKGSGALRKKIGEFLKNNPHIKSFRFGEWNEGGSGVTVIEL